MESGVARIERTGSNEPTRIECSCRACHLQGELKDVRAGVRPFTAAGLLT